MNDATANSRHDTMDRATRHDVMSVNEAAVALGITPDSVRARLRRGSLSGEKIGSIWYVDGSSLGNVRMTDNRATRHDVVHETTRHDTISRDVDLEPLAAVIRDQNHRIEELAAAAAFWQVRAQQAEEKLLQLTAGETEPQRGASVAQNASEPSQPSLAVLAIEDPEPSLSSDDSEPEGFWGKIKRFFTQ